MNKNNRKKLLAILSVSLFFLLTAYGIRWLASTSTLYINYSGDPVDVLIENPLAAYKNKISLKNPTKIRVPKGTYEVSGENKQKDSSSFSAVLTNGFLSTTEVNISLKKYASATVEGPNKKSCSVFSDEIFLTYSCKGAFSEIGYLPAPTGILPIEKKLAKKSTDMYVIDSIILENNIYFVGQKKGSFGSIFISKLYKNQENTPALRMEKVIEDVDTDKDYKIKKYGDGFLLFSKDGDVFRKISFSESGFISELFATPEELNEEGFELSSVDIENEKIIYILNNAAAVSADGGALQTKLILQNEQNQVTKYLTKHIINIGYFCYEKYFCGLGNGNLHVYEYDESALTKKISLYGVESLIKNDSGILYIIKNSKLMKTTYSSNKQLQGNYIFSFSEGNTINSVSSYGSKLSLAIGATKSSTQLIFEDLNDSYTPAIFETLISLENDTDISDVVVHGKYIFVTPNLGEIEYLTDENVFGYNKDRRTDVSERLSESAKALSEKGYVLINLLP